MYTKLHPGSEWRFLISTLVRILTTSFPTFSRLFEEEEEEEEEPLLVHTAQGQSLQMQKAVCLMGKTTLKICLNYMFYQEVLLSSPSNVFSSFLFFLSVKFYYGTMHKIKN